MELAIIGVGYVGLVTGACFAEMGHRVLCLDIDADKIQKLEQGILPFYEPQLKELTDRNRAAGRLLFTTDWKRAVAGAKICFLCVPTPSLADGSCDLSYILSAATQIAEQMDDYRIFVNKSTVPVGTAQKMRHHIARALTAQGKHLSFDILSNPEFLKEGSAVADCMKPDRIIIGADNPKAAEVLKEIYSAFTINHDRILHMDLASAELTKYAANAMLATRISFMNQIAALCEKVGANIHNVRIGIGSDQRIGYHFLYAGAGYGGSCFPKDLRALIATAKEHAVGAQILQAVEEVNEGQKELLGTKILSYFTKPSEHPLTIALLGLAFKPETDDIREAPSLCLIDMLLSAHVTIRAFDPVAMPNVQKHLRHPRLIFCDDEYDAAQGADAAVLITEWKQFRFLDFHKLKSLMRRPVLFDGRNQYRQEEMRSLGFTYFGIGIPPHAPTPEPFFVETNPSIFPCETVTNPKSDKSSVPYGS